MIEKDLLAGCGLATAVARDVPNTGTSAQRRESRVGGTSGPMTVTGVECLIWVKPGKPQCEHMFSAVHPTTDIPANGSFAPGAAICGRVKK